MKNCKEIELGLEEGEQPKQKRAKSAKVYDCTQFMLLKKLYEEAAFSKINLTPSAKLFLWALCSHYNPANETMFPAQATVAKRLGISERSAERAVKELRDKGLLTYVTKRVNHYIFSEEFFRLVKLSPMNRQNVQNRNRQNVQQTYNKEKRNNINFSKNSFFGPNGNTARDYGGQKKYHQPGGKAVPSIEETRKYIEEMEKVRAEGFNPLNYTKKEAIRWLGMADIAYLRYSGVARKLILKYKLKEFEHILGIQQFRNHPDKST